MKKLALCLVMVLTLGMVFGACSSQEARYTVSDGKVEGTLIMGVDDKFPPMGFRDEQGNLVGFDIDLANAVAEHLGVTLEIQPINWTMKEQELNTKNIDIIWNGYTISDERKEQVLFSEPYLKNNQVVVVDKTKGFQTLADLAGKELGVQAGSTAVEALDAAAEFKSSLGNVTEFEDNTVALLELEQGGVDGVAMDEVVAQYYIAANDKDNLVILGEKLAPEEYGIGFRKEDTALRDAVQAVLSEMKQDGTVEEISTKWFGSDVTLIQ